MTVLVPGTNNIAVESHATNVSLSIRDASVIVLRSGCDGLAGDFCEVRKSTKSAFISEFVPSEVSHRPLRHFLAGHQIVDAREYTDGVLCFDMVLLQIDTHLVSVINEYSAMKGQESMLFDYGVDSDWGGFSIQRL